MLLVRIMKSPLGRLIARPWLDAVSLYFLERWFFPLSRLWAAAREAEGDVDRFVEAVPLQTPGSGQRRQIERALAKFEETRTQAFATEQNWRDGFFGSGESNAESLKNLEQLRLEHRNAYNLTRRRFRSLRSLVKTSVRVNPPTPEQVAVRHGESGEAMELLFDPPEQLPVVEISRSISDGVTRQYWVRFNSPSLEMADMAYARVHEPENADNPPTLVFRARDLRRV